MSTAFNQLSDGLSPDEKRELLEKIHSSLNWSQKDSEAIVSSTPQKDEIQEKLKNDAGKLSFFEKLIYKIVAFFMGISVEELVYRGKITNLKKQVAQNASGLVSWESGTFSDVLGKAIYDLYSSCYPLEAVFQNMTKKNSIIEKSVTDLMEAMIPNAKTGVFDFVSLSEMGDLYRMSGQKSRIHKRVKDSIPVYIDSIPDEIYKRVGESLSPLYFLRPLALFPYHILLESFGVFLNEEEPRKYPPFKPAIFKGMSEFLEKLYYALYLANKIEFSEACFRPLFQNYLKEMEVKSSTVDQLIHDVKQLLEEAQSIFAEIPWKEVIQSLNENPYYSMRFFLPQFDVKTFYKSTLTVRFAAQIEDIFPELRKVIIEKEKNALFQNQNSQLLVHYNWENNSELKSLGGITFEHVESLNLLNTFLLSHYVNQILPLMQTLSRIVLQPFKAINNSLFQSLADIETLKSDIFSFDKGLGDDNPDAVLLIRIKQELKSKPLAGKQISDFIQKKDKEAKHFIIRSFEILEKLKKVLEEILEHTSEKMKSSLKVPYIMGGSKRRLHEVIQEKTNTLSDILKLIKDLFNEEQRMEAD